MPQESCESARLKVRVSPGSSRDKVVGRLGEEIKISLTAPPTDGKANESLLKFLAKLLGLKSSQLSVSSGHTSRGKLIKIEGLNKEELESRLEAILSETEESK
jgi:uncharacterized protein (TIGR00251 family)